MKKTIIIMILTIIIISTAINAACPTGDSLYSYQPPAAEKDETEGQEEINYYLTTLYGTPEEQETTQEELQQRAEEGDYYSQMMLNIIGGQNTINTEAEREQADRLQNYIEGFDEEYLRTSITDLPTDTQIRLQDADPEDRYAILRDEGYADEGIVAGFSKTLSPETAAEMEALLQTTGWGADPSAPGTIEIGGTKTIVDPTGTPWIGLGTGRQVLSVGQKVTYEEQQLTITGEETDNGNKYYTVSYSDKSTGRVLATELSIPTTTKAPAKPEEEYSPTEIVSTKLKDPTAGFEEFEKTFLTIPENTQIEDNVYYKDGKWQAKQPDGSYKELSEEAQATFTKTYQTSQTTPTLTAIDRAKAKTDPLKVESRFKAGSGAPEGYDYHSQDIDNLEYFALQGDPKARQALYKTANDKDSPYKDRAKAALDRALNPRRQSKAQNIADLQKQLAGVDIKDVGWGLEDLAGSFSRWGGLGYVSAHFYSDGDLAKLRDKVDRWFNNEILGGPDFWVTRICGDWFDEVQEGQMFRMTPSGQVQTAASVQGERSNQLPKTAPCDTGEKELGGICYDNNNQQINMYYYKFTFYAAAAYSRKHTGKEDVTFNIQLKGPGVTPINLYAQPIKLQGGPEAQSQSYIVHDYSEKLYTTIKISGTAPDEDGDPEAFEISNTIPVSDYTYETTRTTDTTPDAATPTTPTDYTTSQNQGVNTF